VYTCLSPVGLAAILIVFPCTFQAEQLSRSKMLDSVVIGAMAFIWFLMPSDGIAVVANWFYNRVMNVSNNLGSNVAHVFQSQRVL